MTASSTTAIVRAPDGTELLTRRWPRLPGDPPSWGAVLLVHGLGEHSGRYEHVGRWLTSAGLAAHAYDHRGFGGSGGRRAYVERWSQLHDDLEGRLEDVRGTAAGCPVILYGHSMGGLVAAGYVVDGRTPPDRLVLTGPGLDSDVPASRRMAVRLLGSLAPTLAIPSGIRAEALSREPSIWRLYRDDPLNEKRTTLRFAREGIAEQARVRGSVTRLTIPTLVIHGGDDRLVPPAASAVLETSPLVARRVYPGLRHEVHNEPEGADVVAEVVAWLAASLRGSAAAPAARPDVATPVATTAAAVAL